jgi:hypothetical protein
MQACDQIDLENRQEGERSEPREFGGLRLRQAFVSVHIVPRGDWPAVCPVIPGPSTRESTQTVGERHFTIPPLEMDGAAPEAFFGSINWV